MSGRVMGLGPWVQTLEDHTKGTFANFLAYTVMNADDVLG
jgi:hypothetical protein